MGLIPASAGQTSPPRAAGLRAGAHPRECGADREADRGEAKAEGSSPRVRGRRCCPRFRMGRSGLIPASAGQTGVSMWARIAARAHPRECGADPVAVTVINDSPGSSPRVRGRLFGIHSHANVNRLIPASAGQTRRRCLWGVRLWAHPRECGADAEMARQCGTRLGSSPRVRGRLVA